VTGPPRRRHTSSDGFPARNAERPEAIALYEAIIEYHLRCQGEAGNAVSRSQTLKDQPQEKTRLEKLLRDPPPQYVVRSRFYSGRLLVEEGRYEDAIARLGKQQDAEGTLLIRPAATGPGKLNNPQTADSFQGTMSLKMETLKMGRVPRPECQALFKRQAKAKAKP